MFENYGSCFAAEQFVNIKLGANMIKVQRYMIIMCLLVCMTGCGQIKEQGNPYFYDGENTDLNAVLTYYDDDSVVNREGSLTMHLVKNYQDGDVYKLSVADERKIRDFLDDDRLNIYFYVTDDKIYRLWSYVCQDEEVICFYNDDEMFVKYLDTDEKLINNGELVCCTENMDDELTEETGEIDVVLTHQDDRVIYSRTELQEDGSLHYYESFVWEKGKGLVECMSRFGDMSDILYMENISRK